ncbi:MAG: hypothetical protein Q9209_004638 [Squamulea sp. 1 TL-2023]
MQRAAASSSPPSPQTPPIFNDGPPSKRRKTSTAHSPLTQSPLPATPSTDAQVFQAAVGAENAKRTAAVERVAAQAGETKWVLSTADGASTNGAPAAKLRFLTAGYSDIDQDIETSGRRTFGRYRREEEQDYVTAASDTGSSEAEDGEYDDDTDSEDGGGGGGGGGGTVGRDMAPAGAKLFHRAEDSTQAAEQRKHVRKVDANDAESRGQQEVKLNRLISISGGGGGRLARSGSSALALMECHYCGELGHKKVDCPKKARLERRRGDK